MTVDVKEVIRNLAYLIDEADLLPEENESFGKDHLREMAEKIVKGEVTGDKAQRWLGWFQCALVMGGAATFDEMKKINKLSITKTKFNEYGVRFP